MAARRGMQVVLNRFKRMWYTGGGRWRFIGSRWSEAGMPAGARST